jgi:hypothetical protein
LGDAKPLSPIFFSKALALLATLPAVDATVPAALLAAPNAFWHFLEFFIKGFEQRDGTPLPNDFAFND